MWLTEARPHLTDATIAGLARPTFVGSSNRHLCLETRVVSLIVGEEGDLAVTNHWAALSQYFACESDLAVKIPSCLSWEEAGCIQPLAVAVQVCIFG